MESTEWSLPAAYEALAAGAPDRDVLVWKGTRRTWAQVAARARGLAAFLQRRGIGSRRERSELERWECGQATVALVLYNCPEYVEAMLGCFRARAVPFNVNQHYRPEEVRSLLDMVGAEAVVYHRALGPLVREAAGARSLVLVDVDDRSGVPPLAGSTSFEDAAGPGAAAPSLPVPSPDDLCLVCTGGTTGSPKGVLWRQADIFVAAMGGAEGASRESLMAKASARAAAPGSRRRRSCTRPPSGRYSRGSTPVGRSSSTTTARRSTPARSSRPWPGSASRSCRSSAMPSPGG